MRNIYMAIIDGNVIIFLIIIFFTSVTIWFYHSRDIYEPEPLSRIFLAFFYGLLSIIPAFIFSYISISIIGDTPFTTSVVVAPLIEETSKALFVIILARHRSFDGPMDGLIYGAMVGAGFAAGENLLYGLVASINSGIVSGITLTVLRSLGQIIGHPLYTGITGAGIGEAKVGLSNNKYQQIWKAILLHAMWNGASFLPGFGFYLGLGIVIITSIIILRNELKVAIELDRRAYFSGYYERKKAMQYQYQPIIQQNPQFQQGTNPQNWQQNPQFQQGTNPQNWQQNPQFQQGTNPQNWQQNPQFRQAPIYQSQKNQQQPSHSGSTNQKSSNQPDQSKNEKMDKLQRDQDEWVKKQKNEDEK